MKTLLSIDKKAQKQFDANSIFQLKIKMIRIRKKIFLSTLFLLMSIFSFGQKNDIEVSILEKTMGHGLKDSSIIIQGTEVFFPERIHEVFLDTTSNFLTVQLRGVSKNGKWLDNSGQIVQYDLANKKVLWSKKINYQTSNLLQFSNSMILTVGNKSFCLDVKTGENLWEVKDDIYYVDPINSIGLGYKFKSTTGYSNDLEGIDLMSGKIVWKRNLNREYGWNRVFRSNDSTLIVVAGGLHSINLRTGKGWDYTTPTGKKDYKETAALNVVGIAAGLLTGGFFMTTGYNLVRDLISNVLIDSTSIYMASREQLAKIDKESGEIRWKVSFPKDAGKSSIFMNDSIIYMINKGMAFMGSRQLNFGTPFFAAFNRKTGEQKFLSMLDEKNNPVLDFQTIKKELYLTTKNKLMKFSLETGNKEVEKEYSKDSIGELKYFVGNQLFVPNKNNDFESLTQIDSTKIYLYTNQNKVLAINENMNITNTYDFKDLNILYHWINNYKLIAKDAKTFIIDKMGMPIYEIEATSDAFMIGDKLYNKQDNRFIEIDLKEVFKKE